MPGVEPVPLREVRFITASVALRKAACAADNGQHPATAHRRGRLAPQPRACERLRSTTDSLAPEPQFRRDSQRTRTFAAIGPLGPSRTDMPCGPASETGASAYSATRGCAGASPGARTLTVRGKSSVLCRSSSRREVLCMCLGVPTGGNPQRALRFANPSGHGFRRRPIVAADFRHFKRGLDGGFCLVARARFERALSGL